MTITDLWLEAIGHLHPLVLHFPLALGAVAALVEVVRWMGRRPAATGSAFVLVWIAAVTAPCAALSGWFLAWTEGDDSNTLFLHRWTGVASAVLLLVVAIMASIVRSRAAKTHERVTTPASGIGGSTAANDAAAPTRSHAASVSTGATHGQGLGALYRGQGLGALYRLSLLLTALVVGWCGHLGGEMKWGEGFTLGTLAKAMRASFGVPLPPSGAAEPGREDVQSDARSGTAETRGSGGAPSSPQLASPTAIEHPGFDPHVRQVFEAHCASCHLGGRRKGRLSLTSIDSIVRESDEGLWIVKANEPDESELLRRISLPEGDADAMPPKGPRLDPVEIALIERWISQGAK